MPQRDISAADVIALHGAELLHIVTSRGSDEIELGFRTIDDGVYSFLFSGVIAVRMTEVMRQNVVSRAFLSGTNEIDDIGTVAKWASSGSDGLLLTEDAMALRLQKILRGNMLLFYIDPSIGAEIGIMAGQAVRFD